MLETKRFYLREYTEDDLQDVFELYSDPAVFNYLLETPVEDLHASKEILDYLKEQWKLHGIGRWAVIEKETNENIGWSGIKYETELFPDYNYFDLGYRFKSTKWGMGAATETSLFAIDYAKNDLKLKELYAGAHIENLGSNKVLEKVGFRFEKIIEYKSVPHNWYKLSFSE